MRNTTKKPLHIEMVAWSYSVVQTAKKNLTKEMTEVANVYDVANFFINVSNQCKGDFITNLKLNKMLYFAQGHFLSRTGTPLFDNDIEAWKFGPVVRDIYNKYKAYSNAPIMAVDEDFSENVFSPEEINTLIDVACEYGKYQSSYLVTLTHKADSPWSKVYSGDKNSVISKELIREYFLTQNDLRDYERAIDKMETEGYRDSEGYLVLPKEDEDEDWSEYDDI